MPQGLQVFKPDRTIDVDTSTMLPRSVVIGEITSAGSATIIPIAQGLAIGVAQIRPLDNQPPPQVDINGATVSWKGSNNGARAFRAELNIVLL